MPVTAMACPCCLPVSAISVINELEKVRKMKVLIIGGGGREHAIAWKLAQSPRIEKLYCAPGNAGIADLAQCCDVDATDIAGQVALAAQIGADLVFVAPDDPLAMGLVDRLQAAGIRAFGPSARAARIEASKAFAKKLMCDHKIPTADYAVFTDIREALAYLDKVEIPVVIKADGLALGKGVIIAASREEARQAVQEMMRGGRFGQAGQTVVIESFLTGPELTVLAFTDGKTICPMLSTRDHKRAFDHDLGPNTGGMGAVSPGAVISESMWADMQKEIFQPTIDALAAAGSPFRGVIYFGLMLTDTGPKVIEYNARFGDPEAQAVLPLLKTDLLDIMEAILAERLDQQEIVWSDEASCCVVLASGGYPGTYRKGYAIAGLEEAAKDCLVFHAGTRFADGRVVTAGGRVLGITALAPSLEAAVAKAYIGAGRISFTDMQYRKDIGRS